MISITNDSIEFRSNDELLMIQAWGENSIRVRAYADQVEKIAYYHPQLKRLGSTNAKVVRLENDAAQLTNGKIKVVLDHRHRLTFYNDHGKVLLKEFVRQRAVKHDDGSEDAGTAQITNDFNSTLKLKPREFKANGSGSFKTTQRFEANAYEKIFGMGHYQQPFLDQKYNVLELAQRNSQITVPFYVSNLGYGFLWNNPGIGQVEFAKNITRWTMDSSNYIDYWITAGDSPKDILEQFTQLTGRAPQMPANLLGLWQSKLRYRTPEEVLNVADQYQQRGITPSTIAIDYFHWPAQGEYRFDPDYWPHVEQMVETLKQQYHIQPIVSIWPTVQTDAANYQHYLENGYLVRINRGVPMTMQIQGNTVFVDMTHPQARDYVWSLIKKNYLDKGIDYFWLDVAEPGYSVYDFDNYRYHAGSDLQVGNIYPNDYLKMVSDGLDKAGNKQPVVSLTRSAWVGAQKYGALVWSGDIDSSFESLRNQINSSLNMGLAGIPWWTTDVGGFHGGVPTDPTFRQLLVRWFEFATFTPILRMHGDRQPHSKPLSDHGGGSMVTGAPNEIWSYGKDVEKVLLKYLKVREALKPYLELLMQEAHQFGWPLMRTLFYEFPDDLHSWDVDNTYMFGSGILVAPILYEDATTRSVYLPGQVHWLDPYTGQKYDGGQDIKVDASMDQIPVFTNEDYDFDYSKLIDSLKKKVK